MKASRLALALGSSQDGWVCSREVAGKKGIIMPRASPITKSKAGGCGKARVGVAPCNPSWQGWESHSGAAALLCLLPGMRSLCPWWQRGQAGTPGMQQGVMEGWRG